MFDRRHQASIGYTVQENLKCPDPKGGKIATAPARERGEPIRPKKKPATGKKSDQAAGNTVPSNKLSRRIQ